MSHLVQVATLDDVLPGQAFIVEVDDLEIVLFNIEGQIYAMENACIHAGASLGRGEFFPEKALVICPWHGWRFDVTTGESFSSPLSQKTFPVTIEGRNILIDRS